MPDKNDTTPLRLLPVAFLLFALALTGLGGTDAPVRASDTPPAPATSENSAVIFAYQRVGEDASPLGNLDIDTFIAHVNELKAGKYNVLPVAEIVQRVRTANNPLPPHTVGITFDGAWKQTMQNAAPLLDAENIPYTVFFATDMAAEDTGTHLTWQELKQLARKKNVTLGIMPAAYGHMADMPPAAATSLINKAVEHYRTHFGKAPKLFSWPYGEYARTLTRQLETYEFDAAFGQQSGAVDASADFMALPRFTMTNKYGDVERFRMTANVLPLAVSDVVPEDPYIRNAHDRGNIMVGFTIDPRTEHLASLSCFVSETGKATLSKIGDSRIEMRLDSDFPDRKKRINCTLPAIDPDTGAETWRWFGMVLTAPASESDDAQTYTDTPPQ